MKYSLQSFLNNLFSFEKKTRATRVSKTKLLAEPICKKKSIGFPFDIVLPSFSTFSQRKS